MKIAFRDLKSRPAASVVLLAKGERLQRKDTSFDATEKEFVSRAVNERLFVGGIGEVRRVLLPTGARSRSLILVGLGGKEAFNAESLRKAFGVLARQSNREEIGEVALTLRSPTVSRRMRKLGWEAAVRAAVEGWHLGTYSFDACKSGPRKKRQETRLVFQPEGIARADLASARRGARTGEAVASGVNFARDLSNTPANELYPATLAARARQMASRHGLTCRVMGVRELRRQKMGAILGVAQGSSRSPCLIVLEWNKGARGGAGARRQSTRARRVKTLALVGKAVTFDSGGISIKPARGMEDMKFDMAGGAAVLGALQALSVLKPRVHLVGIIPASENLINGSATRPGDVLRSASGKTIEVINTDAEGRLLLADALHYARRFRPDAVVDFATLTGACVVALGGKVSGMMSNDRTFCQQLMNASRTSGERIWELPLFEEAYDAVKSKVADLKNTGGRQAGAITAAAFLANFIEGIPWAHVDIAGTGWTDRTSGYHPCGATGVGVRLMTDLALSFENPGG